jgi:hypothetical protein
LSVFKKWVSAIIMGEGGKGIKSRCYLASLLFVDFF